MDPGDYQQAKLCHLTRWPVAPHTDFVARFGGSDQFDVCGYWHGMRGFDLNKDNGATEKISVSVSVNTNSVELGCFTKGDGNGTWSEQWLTKTNDYPVKLPDVTVKELHYGINDEVVVFVDVEERSRS